MPSTAWIWTPLTLSFPTLCWPFLEVEYSLRTDLPGSLTIHLAYLADNLMSLASTWFAHIIVIQLLLSVIRSTSFVFKCKQMELHTRTLLTLLPRSINELVFSKVYMWVNLSCAPLPDTSLFWHWSLIADRLIDLYLFHSLFLILSISHRHSCTMSL